MNPNIMIVDDNRDACDLLAKLLSVHGYKSDLAYDGWMALGLLDQKPYRLAIIDYRMPGMNGVDLFGRMRRARPEIVGIFLTGYTTIDVVFPAIETGIAHVLRKPPDIKELLATIEQNLGTPAPA